MSTPGTRSSTPRTARSGLAGSLVAIAQPAVGFAIVLATAISMYLDLNYRVYLLRRLFFRRASQNVVAPGTRSDAPARVLLCAHYDAARTGAAFKPKRVARGARLACPPLPPAGALPDPVLVARRPAADPRRPDGRHRLQPDLGSSSSSPP